VKATFIHFDVPLQLPTALRRAATCPPCPCASAHAEATFGWEAAMQELCQAMMPMRERREDVAVALSPSSGGRLEGGCAPAGPPLSQEGREGEGARSPDSGSSNADEGTAKELEAPDTDRISEASTKEDSGSGTPEAPGTPNAPEEEQSNEREEEWTTGSSSRKRAAAARAEKRASAAATRRQGSAGGAGGDALAVERPGAAKGKGLSHFERIEVGIEDDRDFRVVQRLIGPRGKHMQDITTQCKGAKVWIIGRGSRSWEDSVGPLVVCVGATSRPAFEAAAGLVRELLARVHEDHRRFRR